MAFLEEDDSFSPDSTEPPDRLGPPDHDRQVRLRRLIAVVVGLLILILIVLGFRGCLNARKERAYENYVRDLEALTSESQQLSAELFGAEGVEGLFTDPQNLKELEFEAEVKADRSAAEGLVDRAQNLDGPGELKPAQANLVLAYELRRDGLAAISDQIGTALGDEGSEEATAVIAEDMQFFVAGDVLYRRAQQQIDDVLAEGCPTCPDAPDSQFLPDISFLDPTTLDTTFAEITGESTNASSGVHGLGLVTTGGVIAQPGDVALIPDAPVTVSGLDSLEIQVENQGENDESDVTVTVTIDGDDAGTGTIDAIAAGEIATVEVALDPAPVAGDTADIEVLVEPVPGEQVADNNEAAFPVTVE